VGQFSVGGNSKESNCWNPSKTQHPCGLTAILILKNQEVNVQFA